MTRLLILLLCCAPFLAGAADQPLGRLFLTPAERAALDVVRQNSKPPEKIVRAGAAEEKDVIAESTPAVAPPIVTVHGYVRRSDGKSTVWVNGKPVREKEATKDIEVGRMQGNTNQVQIRLPGSGQTVRLKAGQSYDPASGQVADSLKDLPQHTAAEPVAAASSNTAGATLDKNKAKENGQYNGAIAKDAAAKPAPTALPPSP